MHDSWQTHSAMSGSSLKMIILLFYLHSCTGSAIHLRWSGVNNDVKISFLATEKVDIIQLETFQISEADNASCVFRGKIKSDPSSRVSAIGKFSKKR